MCFVLFNNSLCTDTEEESTESAWRHDVSSGQQEVVEDSFWLIHVNVIVANIPAYETHSITSTISYLD